MIGADAGQCLHQGGDAALHGSTAAALADNGDAEHAGRRDGFHKAVRPAAAQKYMGGAAVAVGVGLTVAIGVTVGVGLTAAVGAATGIWLAAAVGLAVVF